MLVDHLLKTKKEFKNLKKHLRIYTSYIYKIELDKACFHLDMTYADFKDLARRTACDKVLRDRAFNIAKKSKYDGYQTGLASMGYKFFDKKSKGSGINDKIKQNQRPLDLATHQLAEKLHKPIIRELKKKQFIQDLNIIFGVLI